MKKKTMIELHRVSNEQFRHSRKTPVVVVLDNVRSEMNVGSVFRTADAFAITEIALCGITATPPLPEIHKTALGAEDSVRWTHYPTALEAVEQLRREGYIIVSVEQVHGSTSFEQFHVSAVNKYAVVFGNEVKGVSQEVVDASDVCVELPQLGTKHSLNIANTAAIVMWQLFLTLRPDGDGCSQPC